jgi:hypothetical protein
VNERRVSIGQRNSYPGRQDRTLTWLKYEVSGSDDIGAGVSG